MNSTANQVLKAFGIKAKSLHRSKGGLVINGSKGKMLILKKTEESAAHIMFSQRIKTKLYENGFENIDLYYTTLNNVPFFTLNNENYVISDFKIMEQGFFEERRIFLKLTEKAAKMHCILKENDLKEFPFNGNNMVDVCGASLSRLSRIKKHVSLLKRLSDFDVNFIKNYSSYYARAEAAFEILKSSSYEEKYRNALLLSGICHNCLKKESVFSDGENVHIFNFSKASKDYFIADLSGLIKRYFKHFGGESADIEEIIEVYDRFNPLSKEDIYILYGFLTYPDGFIKVCNTFYEKKRTWIPVHMQNKISHEIHNKGRYEEYIEGILKITASGASAKQS